MTKNQKIGTIVGCTLGAAAILTTSIVVPLVVIKNNSSNNNVDKPITDNSVTFNQSQANHLFELIKNYLSTNKITFENATEANLNNETFIEPLKTYLVQELNIPNLTVADLKEIKFTPLTDNQTTKINYTITFSDNVLLNQAIGNPFFEVNGNSLVFNQSLDSNGSSNNQQNLVDPNVLTGQDLKDIYNIFNKHLQDVYKNHRQEFSVDALNKYLAVKSNWLGDNSHLNPDWFSKVQIYFVVDRDPAANTKQSFNIYMQLSRSCLLDSNALSNLKESQINVVVDQTVPIEEGRLLVFKYHFNFDNFITIANIENFYPSLRAWIESGKTLEDMVKIWNSKSNLENILNSYKDFFNKTTPINMDWISKIYWEYVDPNNADFCIDFTSEPCFGFLQDAINNKRETDKEIKIIHNNDQTTTVKVHFNFAPQQDDPNAPPFLLGF